MTSTFTPNVILIDPTFTTRLARIRHVLFDFDGTLSLLREGWESLMIPMMLAAISPSAPAPDEIVREVVDYVDHSTGILTIRQMEWLAQAVLRFGLAPEAKSGQAKTAREYKAEYVGLIRQKVAGRVAALQSGRLTTEACLVPGSETFLSHLVAQDMTLYLASGTDHGDVVAEAGILGMERFFDGRIYGALDESEAHDKEKIIQRILSENGLTGDQLLVVGDGPVEIRVAISQGALALGVASDEVNRTGWNQRKIQRLEKAGAQALVNGLLAINDLWPVG